MTSFLRGAPLLRKILDPPLIVIVIVIVMNLIYMIECKRCKKQYIGETNRTLRERFTEHRQATNNPSHANASAAVPTHFNLPDHSIEDMTLIPLELQPTLNTSRRKAREAYLIHRGQTLEPSGMNCRNER